ncbi:MAG: hypothetical protein PUD55_04740 [Firmicutes bacterium]|nr:hypothetical protein [Bacillota bacterium]
MSGNILNKIEQLSKKQKIIVSIIIITIILFAALAIYKSSKNHLLDRKEYKATVANITEASANFTSNEDMQKYITDWADNKGLNYSVDDANNIIFDRDASKRKKDVTPVIICVSYNWQTAEANAYSLATAELIASTKLRAGRYTVIFFNDELNTGYGYKHVSKQYFNDKSKVVYLDTGDKSYISVDSFNYTPNSISIPCEYVPVKCDSAVKIRITGIESGTVSAMIGSQPNPVNALSNVLTKLNNKSIIYQLTDVSIESQGNMYPSGIEATVLINSYNMGTLTSYLDERIKKFEKNYGGDFPDATYTYEVIDSPENFPAEAYSDKATSSLGMVLYTIKNGAYKFDKNNVIAEHEVDEVYALNCIHDLKYEDGKIKLSIGTAALNDAFAKQILTENATSAEFADASLSVGEKQAGLKNIRSRLFKELQFAYVKVNEISSSNVIIKTNTDKTFIPVGFLLDVNDKLDIVHLRQEETTAAIYTNTLLCFIKDQGNFLSL